MKKTAPLFHGWLEDFKKSWLEKDVDSVLNLFSDDLEYFETPYLKIKNKNTLRKEWEIIKDHSIKEIKFKIFGEFENKLVVQFEYLYKKNGEDKKYLGVYLIKFDKDGKCNYFYQVGE